MTLLLTTCPGCQLELPAARAAAYDGSFHASPECWGVFTEVLAEEFGNAVLFGQVHQITVDTYAVQHAGGSHPDKSVGVHLAGLHLSLVQGLVAPRIAPLLQRLAAAVETWPHFDALPARWELTVCDVALAPDQQDHVDSVLAWARHVWDAWAPHHRAVAELVRSHL